MFDIDILFRLTRIKEYSPVSKYPWILRLIFILPLVFLISPQNLFTYKTIIVFLANVFLTASIFVINDVEDAEDDYHDSEKRKRNPIANGELSKKQGYLIDFLFMFIGLYLLFTISYLVFLVGFVLTSIGFFYSWKPIRLKSVPIIDLISHAISLGILQFSTTYLTFSSFNLQFISFLMIIMPFSSSIDILQELRDLKVDKKMKINNTVQNFENFTPKKLFFLFLTIIILGFIILFNTLNLETIFYPLLTFLVLISVFRCDKFFKLYYS